MVNQFRTVRIPFCSSRLVYNNRKTSGRVLRTGPTPLVSWDSVVCRATDSCLETERTIIHLLEIKPDVAKILERKQEPAWMSRDARHVLAGRLVTTTLKNRAETIGTVYQELQDPYVVARYPSGKPPTRRAIRNHCGDPPPVDSYPGMVIDIATQASTTIEALSPTAATQLRRRAIRDCGENGWNYYPLQQMWDRDRDGTVGQLQRILVESLWQDLDFADHPDKLIQADLARVRERYLDYCHENGEKRYLPPERAIPWATDAVRDGVEPPWSTILLTQAHELVSVDIEFLAELSNYATIISIATKHTAVRRPYTETGTAISMLKSAYGPNP